MPSTSTTDVATCNFAKVYRRATAGRSLATHRLVGCKHSSYPIAFVVAYRSVFDILLPFTAQQRFTARYDRIKHCTFLPFDGKVVPLPNLTAVMIAIDSVEARRFNLEGLGIGLENEFVDEKPVIRDVLYSESKTVWFGIPL